MSLIAEALRQITAHVNDLQVSGPIEVRPHDCSDPSFDWPAWGKDAGIYSFETTDKVLYIGRALGASLKQRLKAHCSSKDNEAWVEAIDSDDTRIFVFPFRFDDWYWTASVEAKLNSSIPTVFGKRMS